MAPLNLHDQLERLIARVQRAIAALDDSQRLKRWLTVELQLLRPDPREPAQLDDLSARMRAVRQLQFLVAEQFTPSEAPYNADETEYTRSFRNPASQLALVRQTNFSIEPSLLIGARTPLDLFDLVSPTAKIVGYLRSLDPSLSFAGPLACAEEAQALLRDLGDVPADIQAKLSVLFRSRYHCFNAAIARAEAPQVFELASGISPRGLQWSTEHPGTIYVESDLPALIRGKSKVLRNVILQDARPDRGILHCCGADALDLDSLQHALEYTDPEARLVIVTEGLLLYFTSEELERFLGNMQRVLKDRPQAVWIADLVSRENLRELCSVDPALAAAVKRVFGLTNRAVIADNPFEDERCIHGLLRRHQLRVESQLSLSAFSGGGDDCSGSLTAASICGSRKVWTIGA